MVNDRARRAAPADTAPVATDAALQRARAAAAAVPDPEIPVVTLEDLGILRSVHREGARLVVTLTPTYTGCPATQVIADDVRQALATEGFADADVRLTLSPPWTTDWITGDGRRKLREYGIAPPGRAVGDGVAVLRFAPRRTAVGGAPPAPTTASAAIGSAAAAATAEPETIDCPRCGGAQVERLSEHGSTPCKALYRCVACREPFDYFKPY
jgi:ring-1,2-phenylacetyl-CoA epoxidase subunit PaaD